MSIKVYLDGFLIDTLETFEDPIITDKVRAALQEKGKAVSKIVPVPKDNPKLVIIETEL